MKTKVWIVKLLVALFFMAQFFSLTGAGASIATINEKTLEAVQATAVTILSYDEMDDIDPEDVVTVDPFLASALRPTKAFLAGRCPLIPEPPLLLITSRSCAAPTFPPRLEDFEEKQDCCYNSRWLLKCCMLL